MQMKKVNCEKGYWNLKGKMWVTVHFSENIKHHNSKKPWKYKECMAFSFQILAQLSLKNVWLPQFGFWILIPLAKICFFHIVINCTKIPLHFVSKQIP